MHGANGIDPPVPDYLDRILSGKASRRAIGRDHDLVDPGPGRGVDEPSVKERASRGVGEGFRAREEGGDEIDGA